MIATIMPTTENSLQRNEREAGHEIEVEPDQAIHRILRLTRRAFLVEHIDFRRMVGERVGERRYERADLARGDDRIDDVAAVRTQHATLVGHPDPRDPFPEPVHQPRRRAPPPRVLAGAPHAADVIGAGVHRGEQLADFLGRILQVGIERHDALAAHPLEARENGEVLAVVRVEQDDARHVRPRRELLAQQRRRSVPAAVVDEDHLVG